MPLSHGFREACSRTYASFHNHIRTDGIRGQRWLCQWRTGDVHTDVVVMEKESRILITSIWAAWSSSFTCRNGEASVKFQKYSLHFGNIGYFGKSRCIMFSMYLDIILSRCILKLYIYNCQNDLHLETNEVTRDDINLGNIKRHCTMKNDLFCYLKKTKLRHRNGVQTDFHGNPLTFW